MTSFAGMESTEAIQVELNKKYNVVGEEEEGSAKV